MNKQVFILLVVFCLMTFYFSHHIQAENSINEDLTCKGCNIIIISLTNLTVSHMSSNGYFRDTTPNIDQFNRKSFVFQNAYSPASWTRPAGASLFTSLYPYTHQVNVVKGKILPLDPKIPTLAELLKENGYQTVSYNGGADYFGSYGFAKGFDTYNNLGTYYGGFKEIMPPAMEWLSQNKDEKFFLFLQSYDLHCPFVPPEPFDKKFDPEYLNDSLDFNSCFNSFKFQEPQLIDGKKWFDVYPIEIFGSPKNPKYPDRKNIINKNKSPRLIILRIFR